MELLVVSCNKGELYVQEPLTHYEDWPFCLGARDLGVVGGACLVGERVIFGIIIWYSMDRGLGNLGRRQ